jgi:hypothetical protein
MSTRFINELVTDHAKYVLSAKYCEFLKDNLLFNQSIQREGDGGG